MVWYTIYNAPYTKGPTIHELPLQCNEITCYGLMGFAVLMFKSDFNWISVMLYIFSFLAIVRTMYLPPNN